VTCADEVFGKRNVRQPSGYALYGFSSRATGAPTDARRCVAELRGRLDAELGIPSPAVERLQLAILRSRCPPWPEKAHLSCQESDDKPLDASKRTERYDTSRSSGF
jgi:hypothetical protein